MVTLLLLVLLISTCPPRRHAHKPCGDGGGGEGCVKGDPPSGVTSSTSREYSTFSLYNICRLHLLQFSSSFVMQENMDCFCLLPCALTSRSSCMREWMWW